MFIIKYRKIFYLLSSLLILASLASVWIFGIKQGIDFKGGSILELSFSGSLPTIENLEKAFTEKGFDNVSVRSGEEGDFIIRLQSISPEEKDPKKIWKSFEKDFEKSKLIDGECIKLGRELKKSM